MRYEKIQEKLSGLFVGGVQRCVPENGHDREVLKELIRLSLMTAERVPVLVDGKTIDCEYCTMTSGPDEAGVFPTTLRRNLTEFPATVEVLLMGREGGKEVIVRPHSRQATEAYERKLLTMPVTHYGTGDTPGNDTGSGTGEIK